MLSSDPTNCLKLTEADLYKIESCASIVLLGKRRTGKTTWAKYILQFLDGHIGRFIALCGNKDNAAEWKRIIQPLFVMSKNIEILKKLRQYQDEKVSHYSEQQLPVPKKYNICIILDDCGSDRQFMHSAIMKDILSNGRHYGMTVVILCQYLNQLHPENRDQIDYLAMLYTSNHKNIKKVHSEYVNVCDERTFQYALNACTVDRGLCWIDNTRNPLTIEECVFFKRMPWPFDYKTIGSQTVRDYGSRHFAEPNRSRIRPINVQVFPDDETLYNTDSESEPSEDDTNERNVNKCIFNDRKGAFVVLKQSTKPKME